MYVKIVNMQNMYIKLTNQALMVKAKDITDILMEDLYIYIYIYIYISEM